MADGAKDSSCDDDRDHSRIAGQSLDSDGGDSPSLVEISCSICLELVVDDGSRSMAKLQCGHQFHLDCIGSAFNMKGAMQCPNCRNIEKGQWLYTNAVSRVCHGRLDPRRRFQYRVHWCPFGEHSHAGSFEELEPASTTIHNEFHGHHAVTTFTSTDDNSWSSDHFHQFPVAPQYHHHHHHHHHHHSPSTKYVNTSTGNTMSMVRTSFPRQEGDYHKIRVSDSSFIHQRVHLADTANQKPITFMLGREIGLHTSQYHPITA